MKKFICCFLCILLIFTILGCKKAKITPAIKEYTLTKGINLSALEDNTKPNKFLDKEKTYTEIFEKGFDHIRLPVDFRNYCNSEGVISSSFYKRLDSIIRMANDNGLIVILDFHGWYNINIKNGYATLFTNIWKDIAMHYKDYPKDRLLFELINEPHTTEGGDLDANTLWNLQNSVIAEIRNIDPQRAIIVAVPDWNSPFALDNFKEYNYENLIVAIHIYEPLEFTHQGLSWAGTAHKRIDLNNQMLLSLVQQLELISKFKFLTDNKVILNEFGLNTTGYIIDEYVSEYLSCIARYTKTHNIPWTYWSYRGDFGIYDTGFLGFGSRWRQNVVEALMI